MYVAGISISKLFQFPRMHVLIKKNTFFSKYFECTFDDEELLA